jgi:hypothetical protein
VRPSRTTTPPERGETQEVTMKAIARVLVTATALAVLGTVGTAASASPQVESPKASSSVTAAGHDQGFMCNAGPGPQVDCADQGAPAADLPVPAASPSAPADRAARPVLALFGLLAGTLVVAAAWLRRHRRPREAI